MGIGQVDVLCCRNGLMFVRYLGMTWVLPAKISPKHTNNFGHNKL